MDNHYYDTNGRYTGSAPAHEGSLPPFNATRIPPPSRSGFWPVWKGEGWELTLEHKDTPQQFPLPEPPRFYLTASGTYHREGCRYTKSLGGWLALGEIRLRKPDAKPCASCQPPVM